MAKGKGKGFLEVSLAPKILLFLNLRSERLPRRLKKSTAKTDEF